MRSLIFPTLLLAVLAQCGSTPVQPQATPGKLWNDDDGKVRFMLKMTHHLVAPIKDECIERVLNRLKSRKEERKQQSRMDADLYPVAGAMLIAAPKKAPAKAPAETAAPAVAEVCSDALASCGTCHLPRVNNCDYRITIKDKGEFTGKVVAEGEKLKFQPNGDGAKASEIAPNEIVKAEWLNGGDDIVTWWNFKKLGAKARVVKKMMALAEKNNVGCTNCHLQHGNFKLNDNGKLFDSTGEVNRLVSIDRFLKE